MIDSRMEQYMQGCAKHREYDNIIKKAETDIENVKFKNQELKMKLT